MLLHLFRKYDIISRPLSIKRGAPDIIKLDSNLELPKGWYTVNYNLQGANPHQLHLSFTPQPSASSPLKVSLSPQHKRSSKSIHFIAGGTYNLSLTQSTSNRDEADIEFLSIRRHPPFILALYIIARFTKFVIKNKGRPLYQFPLKKRIAYIKNVLNPKEENTLSPKQQFPQTYSSWRDRNEAHLTSDYFIRQQYEWSPTLSILMPVYNTKPALLKEAIDSIKAQYYKNWQLCIADDASTDPEIGEILEQYAATDPRIKVRYRSENGHIAECSNTALELIESDFTILMDHDDLIPPYALNYITNCLNETPDLDFIYSDQDLINESGDRSSPMFKPQFSPDLFYSQNYLNHLTVLRTQKLRDIGGWKTGYEGAQDYDLYLRYLHNIPHQKIKHIPVILYHWRITEGSTAMSINEKDYAVEAGKRALQDYFNQHYSNCEVSILPNLPYYRIKRPLPKSKPLISIIIPTKDHYETLKACIESVKEKTLYPNYEIIVIDNDSSEDSTLDYLQVLSESEKITVLTHNKPFNYSSINNEAVRHANGEILCFMNNDIEISSPWARRICSPRP